ncbi:MAG: 3-deoxy-8-phosphooctulonate synthase [Myxococcota bacterium]
MKLLHFEAGPRAPLFLIAGPCVIESADMALATAERLAELTQRLSLPYIFKASFDKANRTSHRSQRGIGIEAGLRVFERIKRDVGVPVLTDVHEDTPMDEVADVIDVLQTPAFLCRQTNFMQRVAKTGRPMNVKKGQFLAPWDMTHVVEKCRAVGNDAVMVCERGASFGYNTLVTDMRSLAWMRSTGCPVVLDATHSAQQPGGAGGASSGQREMIPVLARAGVAAGVAGLFMEIHPRPDEAWSDGANQWPLDRAEPLLQTLMDIDHLVKSRPYDEDVDARPSEGP